MLAHSDISTIRACSSEMTEICARTRETVANSQEMLKPSPDTFLGRQHYAMLSLPERDQDDMAAVAILLLIAKVKEQ